MFRTDTPLFFLHRNIYLMRIELEVEENMLKLNNNDYNCNIEVKLKT